MERTMRQNKKTPLRDMTQNGRSAVHFPPRKRPADKGGIFSRMTMLLASTGLALLLTRVPAWAQVVITDQVVIDNGETETIGGTGSTLADPLQLEQNLVIGDASTGTLNVVDGGTLLRRSDGEEFIVWLGNEEASVGTLNVTGTSSVAHINALRLGESGTGILNINDGGHVLLGHATSFAALNTGSSASIAIDGSGSQMYVIGDFIFGGTGDADITLTNGATYGQEDGTTILGAYGGTANVSISGNSYFNPYLLTIGGSGSASLTLSDDGRLDVASILIAENEGSSGTLIFGAAAGEQAVAAGSIYAGYITFGNGTGQIVFNHTGSLDFNTILTGNGSIEAYSGSTYIYSNIDDFTGTINVHGGSLWVDDGIGVTATVGTGGILSTMSQFDAVTILDGGSLGNHTTVDTLLIEGSYLLDKGYSVFADQATIASEVDSSATMTMTDGAIAGFGSLVIGDAGNGALTAEDGASLLVTGQAVIGAQTGSTGSLSLQGSATNFHADQLQIGVDGDGSLFLGDRSSVSIEGGSGFDVAAGTGTGYLSLDGHSHIYVGAGGTIRLGGAGNATVEILAGSDIDASAPDATVIAEQATSTSSLTVSGAGSSYVTRAMSIGEAGQASLIVSDGGGIGVDYNLGRMNTSNQGSGTILVTDSGSLLRVGNLFWSGNDGKIEILDGGKLTARDRVTINTVTGQYDHQGRCNGLRWYSDRNRDHSGR
jgi:T5SS/PEP-CTERM-associated repeat protein